MFERIHSYPSIYALGHRAIKDLFTGNILIEEKIDGSQFSMARLNGALHCRSKGAEIFVDAPEKMFTAAVETAKTLDLREGWVYRGEYLRSPKHNTLQYDRTPAKHIILFDVETGPSTFLSYEQKMAEAYRLGIECVACYYEGRAEQMTLEDVKAYLNNNSALAAASGAKIEGVVVKNYDLFTADKKVAVGKFVSEAFKEVHNKEWKTSNPSPVDFVQQITMNLRTNARWQKAVQHLREAGKITDSPRDIGLLIAEVQADVVREEADRIQEQLYTHFVPHIKRGVIAGLPEWYKEQLAASGFDDTRKNFTPATQVSPEASAVKG